MTQLLLRVLARAGQTLHNPFDMGREYVRPKRGDAQHDLEKISRDMQKVGIDLKKVAKRELTLSGK